MTGAKYGNCATERREGKSKVGGIRLAKRRRKRWYFIERRGYYLVLRRYFTDERRARSPLCYLHRRQTFSYEIMFLHILLLTSSSSWSSQTAEFIRASQFTRSTILGTRVVSQSRYWWSPIFFEERNEKKRREKYPITMKARKIAFSPTFWQKKKWLLRKKKMFVKYSKYVGLFTLRENV